MGFSGVAQLLHDARYAVVSDHSRCVATASEVFPCHGPTKVIAMDEESTPSHFPTLSSYGRYFVRWRPTEWATVVDSLGLAKGCANHDVEIMMWLRFYFFGRNVSKQGAQFTDVRVG